MLILLVDELLRLRDYDPWKCQALAKPELSHKVETAEANVLILMKTQIFVFVIPTCGTCVKLTSNLNDYLNSFVFSVIIWAEKYYYNLSLALNCINDKE